MNTKGSVMVGLIFLVATFSIVIYALLLVIGAQFDFTFRQIAFDKALNISEAGVNYYRWHLAHAPEDYQDGTGGTGPYLHEYRDPQGDLVGRFSLEITPPASGSSIVTIKSTGWAEDFPNVKRVVTARYGLPSFAGYSFLSDSSLWFGSGITVGGPIHSNNGIRMDGVNTTTVSSAKENYTCGSETGCSPPTSKPGVWGAGGPDELWEFPVPATDFDAISVDFAAMKTAAQASNGIYLGYSQAGGYHAVFASDGTVSIYKVLSTRRRRGYDSSTGCTNLYQLIRNEELVGSYSLSEKNLLFVEDTLWVEGVVEGQMMVAAARFPIGTYETNIWIKNNVTYKQKDGTDKLGIIAQHDIYYVLDIPNNFEIDAAMLAQTGKIIRHYYAGWWFCSWYGNAVRNNLTVYGTVISREKSYWNWGSPPQSGFTSRNIVYDQSLLYEPPPYFPSNGEYEFISWREE